MNCFIVCFGFMGSFFDLSVFELLVLDFFFDEGDVFLDIEIG